MSFNYTPDAQYPGADALYTLLVRNGMVLPPLTQEELLFDLAGAVAAAMQEFENATGWRPFLAGSEDETRYFAMPGISGDSAGYGYGYGYTSGCGGCYGVQDLEGGLLTCSGVMIGTTPLSLLGTIPQYDFLPYNAPQRKLPYRQIRILQQGYGGALGPKPLAVTGRWGYCQNLPADVWAAVLGYAAREIGPGLSIANTGGASSYTEMGVTESVKQNPYQAAMDQWAMQFGRCVARYRRYSIA